MKILIKLATKNSAKFLFKTNPTDQVAISEKLGGRAEWAKNQLRDKTKTALDTLGDLTKLKFFSRENVITLLNTKEAQQNWTRKNGGRPQNSARYVMALQAGLQMLGETPGEVDALYGVKTKSAVLSFQKKYGLKVDGAPGPETIGKMLELLKAEEQKNPAKNKEKEENENDSEKIKKEFADKAQKLIDQLDGNQKTAWFAALKAILNNFKASKDYRDEWLEDLKKTVAKNSRDLPKKSDKNKEKKEIKSSGKIDWSKHQEFKNKVSEKFMQALLDNKEKLQKELKIPDDLYKDLMALSFADLQLEGAGGKYSKRVVAEQIWDNPDSLKYIPNTTDPFKISNYLASYLVKFGKLFKETKSKGWTQINIDSQGKETREIFKKFGITKNSLWNPKKAAIATMILKSQQYKSELRKFKKLNPKLTNLEIMEYMQYNRGELIKGSATPDKNKRIQKAKKYFQIGKEIIGHTGTSFTEKIAKTTKKSPKNNKEYIKGNIDWSDYKGKNNWHPNNTPYPHYGCSSFTIRENGKKEGKPNQNVIDGNAWEQANNIVYGGGWEIYNAFKGIKLDKSKKTNHEISSYIRDIAKDKQVDPSKLKVGDIVNILFPASSNFKKAYPVAIKYQKTGKIAMPVTHVGQVTEHNGKLYITHNVHGVLRSHPIMDLVTGKKNERNDKSMKIVGVFRPNTKETREYITSKE